MIPNNMALVPVNSYQRAAMQAIITVEDKIQRGKRLGQYPYARELLRELYGSSHKVSAENVHRAAGRYDHQGRKSATKDDIIRALDILIASHGEICPHPLSTDHGYLYFPEVRYRLRERHHRKCDLKVARRLSNEERERQQKRRRYQVQVAQAEIELAFITPSELVAWYKRQERQGALAAAGKDVADLNGVDVRAFTGSAKFCKKFAVGFSDCCKDSGWGQDIGIANCSTEEKALGKAKEKQLTVSVGEFCSKKVLGVCLEKKRGYCQFDSKLAQIVQQQGRNGQLRIGFGAAKSPDCRGITQTELQQIKFDNLDFSNFFEDLQNNQNIPDNNALTERVREQIATQLQSK